MLFADCYVDDALKKHPLRVNNKTNERKFKYEKEKSRRQWIIAIVDCSTPPPNTHNLFNFGWAYFGCYSDPLSPATSPTLLMLVLRGRPDLFDC
jgi:hypothetical protein